MRAWKKWSDKRSKGRIQIDVSLTRQFVKRWTAGQGKVCACAFVRPRTVLEEV